MERYGESFCQINKICGFLHGTSRTLRYELQPRPGRRETGGSCAVQWMQCVTRYLVLCRYDTDIPTITLVMWRVWSDGCGPQTTCFILHWEQNRIFLHTIYLLCTGSHAIKVSNMRLTSKKSLWTIQMSPGPFLKINQF